MLDAPELPTWQASAERLIAVAAGRRSADLVVRGGTWVNVQTREALPEHDIAIAEGRFAYCGPDAGHCIGDGTEVVDARGMFMVPGLCDGHMHIESGMLTPARFAEAVAPRGTTSMFVDPHEIANVMGLEGVRLMHDEAALQPVNIFVQMPSCVPSAPGLETPGATVTPEDVAEAMTWPGIIGLGEMMNFPGVVDGASGPLASMSATRSAGKTIGGHYASPDLGRAFHAYAAGGPADDHEGTREADAVARARLGIRPMLRLGSAWHDVESQITAVTERGLDPRNFILCTDDCHPGTLVNDGHMDRVVRHAIECGCDPLVALQMATVNTAAHFGLEREIGSIAPGRRADFLLAPDLETLPVRRVFCRGREVAADGKPSAEFPGMDWPRQAVSSVNYGRRIQAGDFAIKAPQGRNSATAKVIRVEENQAPTKAARLELPVRDSLAEGDPEQDVCQVAVIERHRGTGRISNGFVGGFGYRGAMAVASSVAHDCHNVIVVGTDRGQMACAANRLQEIGGGVSVWKDGAEIASVRLSVAGLMSDGPAAEVAAEADRMNAAIADCGCRLNNAFMQHSLLALAVIPELRISDLGIVDAERFAIVPLFEEG